MRLLTASDEGLSEETAYCFPAMEPQKTGARGEAEEFLWPGSAQPLKVYRELRIIKIKSAGSLAGTFHGSLNQGRRSRH